MLEYELNGKIYTENDLINAAGGKDKLSAYIKSKGFKPATKKVKQPVKQNLTSPSFGFNEEGKYAVEKDTFAGINKTKKKPTPIVTKKVAKATGPAVVKKQSDEITWADLAGEESTVAEGLNKKLSKVGLTPEEATFGLNRITIRGDKKQPLYYTINKDGIETAADLPEVAVGANLTRKELEASAKKLNEYVKIHGNKDYIKKVKSENPNLIAQAEAAIAPKSRTIEEKIKLYNTELDTEFKTKETQVKNRLGIKGGYERRADIVLTNKDFDTPEKYSSYKVWKKTGQIPLPSEQNREKFIGEYNDNYRATKSSEFMSDASQEQRTMLQALEAENEEKSIQQATKLKAQGFEIDKKSKAFSEKAAMFEKTPPTPQELDEYRKEYFALHNESAEYNKEILKVKKDFNNIKAISQAASKDYNRLNQTGSLLKQTALGILGGTTDILATVASVPMPGIAGTYSSNKSFLKETLLDPIYAEQKAAGKELESYQQNLSIKDIKSMKDLGRWGAGVLTQMPSSMAIAVTGEAALPLFFLSGYGSKQYEIADSQEKALSRLQYYTDQIDKGLIVNEDMADVQKQIASDKKTLNISEGAKLTSQLLAGTAEVLFEKYGTLGIIKETNNILRSIPAEEIKRQLKTIGKEMGKSAGVEAWTEGLTQFANNFGDIHLLGQDKNYFDGVPDSMAAGAFMGPGFAAVGGAGVISNNITKSVISELATKEEFKARDRKLDEIKKLTGLNDITGLTKAELDKLTLQPPVKKAVEELINQMDGEDLRILDRLGKDFSIKDAKKVGDFNQKLRKITKDWNEASRTGGIDDAQLRSLKEYYQKQYNDTFVAREALLKDDKLISNNKKESAKNRISFEATAGYRNYAYRTTRKTYLERKGGFDSLPSDDKQRYNDLAISELSKGVADAELSDEQIKETASELYAGEEISNQLDKDIEAANSFSEEVGLNIKVETVNSEKELLEKYSSILEGEDLKDITEGRTNAFNIGDDILVVYKPNAIKNGHTSSGSHEVLHTVLSKAFKGNQEEANKNGIKLLEYLKTEQPSLYASVEERMKGYKPEYKAYGEEVFNALSDSFSDGKIPNDSAFTQISKAINRITNGALGESETFNIKNINTDSGKALFDTIKAYNRKAGAKKTKAGQNIRFIFSDTEEEIISKPTPPSSFKTSKTKVIEVQKKIDKLEDQFDNDEIEYDDYTSRLKALEIELEKAEKAPEEPEKKPEVKKVATEEDEVKEIIKSERGSVASDKVQKIYEEEGEKGAGKIIKLFKPITAKIVAKRRDAPGFNEEDLTSEIENGAGGLFDLIRSYDAGKGVPLAAYINKNLPLRAITSSRRILEGEFKKDVSEEKGIMAEETVVETKEKPKYRNALEANVFTPDVLKTVTNKIVTIVRTLKSRIDAPVTLNRTITPLIAEIRDEVGKQLDIDIKTMLGGKKDGVLKKELLRNKKYILENMTTTWLMGKDGQGGIPQAIQKQIDGKWVSFPDWVGQKIDREKTTTDQAGRTSGAELVRRLPNVNNNVSNEEFLAQIIGPDGNPIRGRKESISKAMSEEGAFDIIKEDFENDGPILEAFNTNQERQGVEINEVLKAEFNKQVDRGNIKFSKVSNRNTALFLLQEGNWKKDYPEYKKFLTTLSTPEKEDLKRFTSRSKILIDKYDEVWNKNRGVRYEKNTYIALRKLKKYFDSKGIVLEEDIPDRFNSIKPDLVLVDKETGNRTVIELKSNLIDPMGSTSNGNFINKNIDFTKQFLGINILEEAMNANSKRNNLINKLKQLIKEGSKDIRVTPNGIQISNKLYKELDRSGTSTYAEIPIQAISDINPGKDILQVENVGAFAFPGSKVALLGKVPVLTGTMFVSTDFRTNSAGKGWRTLLERAYFNLDPTFNQKTNINLDTNPELFADNIQDERVLENINAIKAINESLKPSKVLKGISVFDFDDTVGMTKSNVLYSMPDGTKGKLNAEEFAKDGASMLEAGAIFDFSEFSKVVNGKPGPMVEKMKKMIGKFGPENFFILTARPANAAGPIHEFLSSIGINIPLENITGLGNSSAQAKADWMVGKAAKGYNDFYFSDDAIQNVTAVKNALDVLDVKSKIQQAKIKFSKTMSDEFNKIIEENTGMESYKVFSDITARRRGVGKNKFDIYVPPSAADFELLLYNFMGKGDKGEKQKQFLEDALLKPYTNGVDLMDAVRQSIKKEYKALLNSFPEVRKELEKLTPNKDFTYDQAMRVAIWSQFDVDIPGLSMRDKTSLTDLINNDPDLTAFKDGLIVMGRQDKGWLPPKDFWDADTIVSDLYNITEGSGRKKFLGEFIDNVESIFGKWDTGKLVGPNMNKIEAVYGTNVREALEDSIYRMTNGKNRSLGQDKETTAWSNWINGSTGSIMFLNTRSAALQMLGAVNFLNFRDNNPFNAGKAFLNQPQYWKDFARIWNSDKLKERRGGLREDVASAEIANAAAGSKNKAVAVIAYLLKIGYTPTQLADSFAIASGGAPFYRNRIKSYQNEYSGLDANGELVRKYTDVEAEKLAWKDFSKISDETQQSGDPKDISKQQSSAAGRLLLVFQNFTMQQSRIVKKSFLDLKNGRGDAKTHLAKIAYYVAVQNIMFSTLQQGLFAVLFTSDEGEDEEKKKKKKTDAIMDIANGVLDSVLRGTGFVGGIIATLKNVGIKYFEEKDKKFKADYTKVVLEATNISPPIGSKARKLYSALQQTKFEKDLIDERGWGVMQDGRVHLGPMYGVTGKLVEVSTNLPMDRLVNKVENVSQALNSQNTAIQRVATGLGYSPWTVGIKGTKGDILIKEKAKEKREEEGIIKAIVTRKETAEKLEDSLSKLSTSAYNEYIDKRNEEKIRKRNKKRAMLEKLNANE